ncbi:uncharacterized protein METZ01_LOCUS121032 [marine metagenome]|uniref:Uncharacterized protein n=1 Tax=marine metagenome TaxID=408172 RepID=A0A381XTW5_9ZZZZ
MHFAIETIDFYGVGPLSSVLDSGYNKLLSGGWHTK